MLFEKGKEAAIVVREGSRGYACHKKLSSYIIQAKDYVMKKSLNMRRLLINVLLAALIGCPFVFIGLLFPTERHIFLFTVLLGYLCLILLFASLLIGPLTLFRFRRNPVNIDLRRDIGIWAAIIGCYHVALVFQMSFGSQIIHYFFSEGTYLPLLNIYGLSNDTGLFATILLVLLLALSNTFSLRYLKGKRWKQIQQLNYILVPLALLHTFGYQYLGGCDLFFVFAVLVITVFVLVFQIVGIAIVRSRRKERERGGPSSRRQS